MAFELGECLLRTQLKRNDMKPSDFAKRMKCSRQYVNDLLTNRTTMSLIFAINASILLNCKTTDLYILTPRSKQE